MVTTSICLHHKFGYCKFGQHCRLHHSDVICQKIDCEIYHCGNRHPKRCRYHAKYSHCKFGSYCSFLHFEQEDVVSKVVAMNEMEEKFASMKSKLNAVIHILFLIRNLG